LSRLFSRIRGIGGSTVLGTGQLALIVDVPSLLDLCLNTRQAQPAPRRALMD
jgi:two-component system chemotaxis sensor kinase CheA